MKILFLGDYQESEILTGPQKFGKRLAFHSANRHHVTFASYFQDGNRYSIFKKLFGIRTIVRKKQLSVYRLGLIPLVLMLISRSFDVIHLVSFERYSRLIFMMGLKKNARTIYTAHSLLLHEYNAFATNASEKYRRENLPIERMYFDRCDQIIPVSLMISRFLASNGYLRGESLPVYSGADEIFHRQQNGRSVGDRTVSLVFIGNIDVLQKGFDILEQALMKCTQPLHLIIISSVERTLNLPSTISYRYYSPVVTELFAQILSGADIVVTPSRYDTFSISTLEAMACGCIPIVSDAAGISELIPHELSDYIFTNGSAEDLHRCIERLSMHAEENSQLQNISAVRALEYSWERTAKQYERLYRSDKKE